MRILQIILLAILSLNTFCQNDSLIIETIGFIKEVTKVTELNPMYQEETEEINILFNESAEMYLKGDKQKNATEKIEVAFSVLYKNSTSIYEDSQEERRYKSRRAICFAAISLMSEMEISPIYIEYAKYSIKGNTQDVELMEQQYLGLMFIELLLKYKDKTLSGKDLVHIESFLESNEDMIQKSVINQAKQILSKFKNKD